MLSSNSHFSPSLLSPMSPMWRPHNQLTRIFMDLNEGSDDCSPVTPTSPAAARPSYRLASTKQGTSVEVELPGVKKEHIDIQVKDHVMELSALRYRDDHHAPVLTKEEAPAPSASTSTSQENSTGEQAQHQKGNKDDGEQARTDRAPVVVYRLRLQLSSTDDHEKTSCKSYENGILSLHIPKRQEEAAHTITIN